MPSLHILIKFLRLKNDFSLFVSVFVVKVLIIYFFCICGYNFKKDIITTVPGFKILLNTLNTARIRKVHSENLNIN
jgi:hypothetical protein